MPIASSKERTLKELMPNGPVKVVPDQKCVFPSEQEMCGALAVIITPCFVIIVVQPAMFLSLLSVWFVRFRMEPYTVRFVPKNLKW